MTDDRIRITIGSITYEFPEGTTREQAQAALDAGKRLHLEAIRREEMLKLHEEMLDQVARAWRPHMSIIEAALKALAAAGFTMEDVRLRTYPELNGGRKDVIEVQGIPTLEVETKVEIDFGASNTGMVFHTFPPAVLAHVAIVWPAVEAALAAR
jgi:hypothetical protein